MKINGGNMEKTFEEWPKGLYTAIYADPPWQYTRKNGRGIASDHYETMSTSEIAALPVRQICTKDAMCFMWATFPNLAEALTVMRAWGFTYKTAAFVWVKQNHSGIGHFCGMGCYTRANAEVCLLGVSRETKVMSQVISHSVRQIIESPVMRHSQKPDETRERIVQLLGDVPRIELFARERAPGWDAWGNELPE